MTGGLSDGTGERWRLSIVVPVLDEEPDPYPLPLPNGEIAKPPPKDPCEPPG